MITEILIFLLTTIITYFVYSHKKIQNKFKERGISYFPGIPVFGNVYKSTFLKRHIVEDIDEVYKAFPNDKYVGYIEGTAPIIMIRDPELVKSITVKDFDHFIDHKPFFAEGTDVLFGESLFLMRGEKWRDMRTTLSPAFTGSKMRQMMPFMSEISNNIIEYLKEHTSEDVDVADLVRRYTNDVIASAGFGLQVNSVKERENEFYKTGQNLFVFTTKQRIVMFLMFQFPKIAQKLGLTVFPENTNNFFKNIVSGTMEYREKNNVERPDMIQLLMEASKNTLKNSKEDANEKDIGFATVEEELKPQEVSRKWTQNELAAQVFIFFIAGFESSASAIDMAIHELALKPDVQEKLYQELKAFNEKHENLAYDNIGDLKYLDCVLNETLRKWSPALVLDRQCAKPYDLPPTREGAKPYRLNPGDIVYNVVNSIQMDPKYFPNPEVFDPDRFSDENKHNIQPFTFLPFGVGPRNCIGSRFALLEVKVLLYHIVLNFQILKCAKTTDPIRLLPQDFNIKSLGGSYVRLEARN